ncbi:MAG TPA: hypothetical protein VFW96_01520 [Thermomicrobiales bacterium]|nr:hypothetical protein [Thermomicrobiales bacterium]
MSGTTTGIVILVILFVVFRRARGLLTRQKIRPSWLLFRLALFAVLGAVVLALTATHPATLAGDLAGLALGLALAWFGLRLTRFENLPDGTYFTPNLYIGLAVFAVFVVRFVYRFAEVALNANALASRPAGAAGANPFAAGAANPFAQYSQDPLTAAAYFLLIGYYVWYYAALLLRQRRAAAIAR